MEGLSKKQEAFEHAVFLFRLKFFTSKNTRLSLKECKLSNNLGKTEEERIQMVTFSLTNVSQYLFLASVESSFEDAYPYYAQCAAV